MGYLIHSVIDVDVLKRSMEIHIKNKYIHIKNK